MLRFSAEDYAVRAQAIAARDAEILGQPMLKGVLPEDVMFTKSYILPRGFSARGLSDAQKEQYSRLHFNLAISGLKISPAKTVGGKEAKDGAGNTVYEFVFTGGQRFKTPAGMFGALLNQHYNDIRKLRAEMIGVKLTREFLALVAGRPLRNDKEDKVAFYRKRALNSFLNSLRSYQAGEVLPFYALLKLYTATFNKPVKQDVPGNPGKQEWVYSRPGTQGRIQSQLNEDVKNALGFREQEIEVGTKRDGTPKVVKRLRQDGVQSSDVAGCLRWMALLAFCEVSAGKANKDTYTIYESKQCCGLKWLQSRYNRGVPSLIEALRRLKTSRLFTFRNATAVITRS